ncbi:hypothetical protein EK21DRAFT_98864 [Setomelanomma holmii]|uniref:Uncharacterized protein n=1 Tax=Setomelanomma holmii TaxID=210430 RepID=A0A9P4LMA5_9PLEO|nr:hypothetical protein EK21DRAFT_98864 [Setomelanomma holmii]
MKLQETGRVHNINLVTPEHVVSQVVLSILHARELGLRIPIIYNTSSFDSLHSIELLSGLIDIYLPDFKVWSNATSKRLLKADNYTATAMESIKAMHDQVGDLCFTADGIAKKGVLVRHLVMPGKEDEGKEIMKWLAENVSKDIMVHIMEQYFPRAYVGKARHGKDNQIVEPGGVKAAPDTKKDVRYADINRSISSEEVSAVKHAAEEAGLWRFRPTVTMHDFTTEIQAAVHQLKIERDTWQAVALQYKAAFETQSARFQELQDVCFATQAELENERAQQRQLHTCLNEGKGSWPRTIDGTQDPQTPRPFGTAVMFPGRKIGHGRSPSDACTNPLFSRVQQCVDQRNYGSALVELDCLLRGPLSPKARAEGLLLKSGILRASGPDELYDALAACSEALELCDRLSDLESFLPRIQYQRGVLFYQLRMLHQARDVFSTISDSDRLSATANEYCRSCDDEICLQRAANRRSGFDENRTFDEGLLVHLDEKLEVNRRQCARGTAY